MKTGTWLVVTHHRPKLLKACLETLHEATWPMGWRYEIVVAHHKDDTAGRDVARDLGCSPVASSSLPAGGKRNVALAACLGELVLVADDDDFQSPLRPAYAVHAYNSGYDLSGVREYRRLHMPSGMVTRWCGRGGPGIAPIRVSIVANYKRSILTKVRGWDINLKNGVDTEIQTRIRRRSVREKDLGAELADSTICIQHDTNVNPREIVPAGETARIGRYVVLGEGHYANVPNFPRAVAVRLGLS